MSWLAQLLDDAESFHGSTSIFARYARSLRKALPSLAKEAATTDDA